MFFEEEKFLEPVWYTANYFFSSIVWAAFEFWKFLLEADFFFFFCNCGVALVYY